jgi:hypothetical protein
MTAKSPSLLKALALQKTGSCRFGTLVHGSLKLLSAPTNLDWANAKAVSEWVRKAFLDDDGGCWRRPSGTVPVDYPLRGAGYR